MDQDDDRPELVGQASETRDRRNSARVWPGVLLVVVILILILLLWWYSQRPQPAPLTAVRETAEIPVVVSDTRPEPTIPSAVTTGPAEEPDGSRVPDVVGDRRSAAEDAVRRAGYDVAISTVYSTSKASGFVVAQTPSGGTELDSGETVAIVVSVATSTAKSVRMPEIVGLTQSSAETKVKQAGLVPYLIYGDAEIEPGRVISQWPDAGESVAEGSEGFIQIQLEN